jgi:antitoxin (DNA-binding transcriptional repressor) of toxin-antitoxin stability system
VPVHLDVKAAEKDLDALLDRACSGEDIVIDIQGVPMVRLVPLDPSEDLPTTTEAWGEKA